MKISVGYAIMLLPEKTEKDFRVWEDELATRKRKFVFQQATLCRKCPNTEFFLVIFFSYLD